MPSAVAKAESHRSVAEKDFQPSEDMLKVLAAGRKEDFLGKPSKWCKAAGLHASVFGTWARAHAGFARWWLHEAERHFCTLLPRIWGQSYKRAVGDVDPKTGGSHHDTKLMLERLDPDYVPRQKTMMAAAMALGKATPTDLMLIDDLLKLGAPNQDVSE